MGAQSRGPEESGTGVRLGKYVLDAPLGMGGMAEVFKGHTVGAEGFQRPVAIKRVLPDASRNPAFSEMFVAEAKLSSRMQHANIVSVLDFDRDVEGRLYLVMELVEGRDLNDIIDSGRLPYSIVIYTIAEVLRGLGYAHDLPVGADGVRGLVHRDVSPHNVLCSWSGAVKVSDFGIAKARAATAASASMVIKGKPAYMSPEQINGSPLDGRSDLFAVGVMLWQMLTGQYLFASGTTTETLARVLFGTVAPPRTLVPDVPMDLEAVVMKLLAREPGQRYATAEDAVDDLLQCQHAPRDGRRELEHLLIERFPHKAPVRTGQRSRPAPAAATPVFSTPPTAWSPAQAAAMAADTRTAAPPPPSTVPGHVVPGAPPSSVLATSAVESGPARRTGLLAAVAAIVIALAVVVVVVASSGGSQPASAPSAGPPIVTTDGGADPVDAAAGDAATSEAAPLVEAGAPLVDAGVPLDARRRGTHGTGSTGSAGSGSASTIHDIELPK